MSWPIVPSNHFTISREVSIGVFGSSGDDALVVNITVLYSVNSKLAGVSDSNSSFGSIREFAEGILHSVLELDCLGGAGEKNEGEKGFHMW